MIRLACTSSLGVMNGRVLGTGLRNRRAGMQKRPLISLRRAPASLFRWMTEAIWFLLRAILIGWAALAIYYSNLPWLGNASGTGGGLRGVRDLGFWLSRRRRMSVAFAALFLGVVAWWIAIPPSHDRQWRPEVAVMPRAIIDGDRVRITGVRNFDYRSRDDFTARYEEREVQLSHLTGLDFYVSYWRRGRSGTPS